MYNVFMATKDTMVTLADLKEEIAKFVTERNWDRFQNIRNLAISLSLEANEFLDHFQWFNDAEVAEFEEGLQNREIVGEELSDILAYVLIAAQRLDIDLGAAFLKKIEKNRKKYPAEKFQNLSWEEDNKLYQKAREQYGSTDTDGVA